MHKIKLYFSNNLAYQDENEFLNFYNEYGINKINIANNDLYFHFGNDSDKTYVTKYILKFCGVDDYLMDTSYFGAIDFRLSIDSISFSKENHIYSDPKVLNFCSEIIDSDNNSIIFSTDIFQELDHDILYFQIYTNNGIRIRFSARSVEFFKVTE